MSSSSSRLSFRPRPLDIHKKLPIIKSLKDFEDDDTSTTRNFSQITTRHSLEVAAITDGEAQQTHSKKVASEIPIPQFVVVDTYERDYLSTFTQPASYLRGRGARSELGDFVEYDLDNEDEDWLEEFNNERKILSPERFENLLFKLEVLDHKTRERAGIITPNLGSPVPVLVQLDVAAEALQSQNIRHVIFQSVYNYWKAKRERWQRPILRHLQPPPPVNDTNPYNVFRPREKAHRLHTRRMQRRENNVQSFEKLRQIRRNLDQAKTVLEALIKREEKKREVMKCEVNFQRTQMKYKHETRLFENGLALSGFPSFSQRSASNDDYFIDSKDLTNGYTHNRFGLGTKPPITDSMLMKREPRRRPPPQGFFKKEKCGMQDPLEPLLLFTKPVDPERLAAAGIRKPPDPPINKALAARPYRLRARIGRGGRIIFDRLNPSACTTFSDENSVLPAPSDQPLPLG
ncbi:hypothetical protein AMTRI_Chr01g115030 [Amborella trichopoda]